MVYKDYLNAARKHKITCEVIADNLEKEKKQNSPNREKVKSLTLNLYYLSGYIIECMVKYGIYSLIGYGREDDVKYLDKEGLSYDTHIKHHRFERYTEHLVKRISGNIPLINHRKEISKDTVNIYKEWDAEIRYSYELKYDETHYMKFYECAKNIFEIIRNNTKG